MTYVKRSVPKEPIKLKVKKGDLVEVISGKDKGKRGEVLAAMPKENKVLVKEANIRVKHAKDKQSSKSGATPAAMSSRAGALKRKRRCSPRRSWLSAPRASVRLAWVTLTAKEPKKCRAANTACANTRIAPKRLTKNN